MTAFEAVAEAIAASSRLVDDFRAICACGGRFAGTPSEAAAVTFLERRLSRIGPVRHDLVTYRGWTRIGAGVTLPDGRKFAACALGRSPSAAGLTRPLIDLGRGAPSDFERHAAAIAGRIVLVRHEYMQSASHIHRRRKYEQAKAMGAAGFLIACNVPGDYLVAGSTGTGTGSDIAAASVSYETGAALAEVRGDVTLSIAGEFDDHRQAANLLLDIPGQTDEWVVLSAHIDGHHLAQSAIDNASGLACAITLADLLQDHVRMSRRGLRLALFNVEEWAMIGSRDYLARCSPDDRRAMIFNLNLDAVAGSSRLGVMTSGIPSCERLVADVEATHGFGLATLRPFMNNSDHANFILAGIPALRILAGVEDPESNQRYLLTNGDTEDKVTADELRRATSIAAAFLLEALERDFPPLDDAAVMDIAARVP